jgi:hypothetical protein
MPIRSVQDLSGSPLSGNANHVDSAFIRSRAKMSLKGLQSEDRGEKRCGNSKESSKARCFHGVARHRVDATAILCIPRTAVDELDVGLAVNMYTVATRRGIYRVRCRTRPGAVTARLSSSVSRAPRDTTTARYMSIVTRSLTSPHSSRHGKLLQMYLRSSKKLQQLGRRKHVLRRRPT